MSSEKKLQVTSPAFKSNEMIPGKYTCQGENNSPALQIKNIPPGTSTLAIILDDPDAPSGIFTHWVCWNITPMEMIDENAHPGEEGQNDFGKTGYGGPCPPSGKHRYFFKVYALDCRISLPANAGKEQLLEAIEGHVIEEGELVGVYEKSK